MSIKHRLLSFIQKTARTVFSENTRSVYANLERHYKELLREITAAQPETLIRQGYSVYSQNEEDGIIRHIFTKLGIEHASFIEFGVHATQNNSLNIILNGGRGVWVDMGLSSLKKEIRTNSILQIRDELVTLDNIYHIYKDASAFLAIDNAGLDLLSLDLDGNDYYFINELLAKGARPKLFCLEYNPKFPPPSKVRIKYNSSHVWENNDYYGCSLQEYADLLAPYGYTLLVCNITGSNCFFLRNEYVPLFTIYGINELYQPARPFLSPIQAGNVSSLKYLHDLLQQKANDNV